MIKYHRKKRLFETNDILCIWAIFCFSFILRVYQIHRPEEYILNEKSTFDFINEFWNEYHYDGKPFIGRALLTLLFKLIYRNEINLTHFRVAAALISTITNSLITAALRLEGCSIMTSFLGGYLVSIDFGMVVTNRSFSFETIAPLLISIALFLKSYSRYANVDNHLIIISVLASLISPYGYIVALYHASLLIFTRYKDYITLSKLALAFLVGQLIDGFVIIYLLYSQGHSFKDAIIEFTTYFYNHYDKVIHQRKFLVAFPLWKYIPTLVWENEDRHIYLFNNAIMITLSSILSIIWLRNRESSFYFISIICIWFAGEGSNCFHFQIPLLFSSITISKLINKFRIGPILVISIVFFTSMTYYIWGPWVYGLKITEETNRVIDIWRQPDEANITQK